ncbi:MAG TPA: hypothetical protein VIM34_04340 [Burkholderiaceae bacterium]
MKTYKLALLAALLGACGLASAAEPGSDAAREQRMNETLARYHDSRNPSPGPAARTEESVKTGMSRTGHAIKRGARKVGHAVRHGAHETGEAIHHVGQKMEGTGKTGQ